MAYLPMIVFFPKRASGRFSIVPEVLTDRSQADTSHFVYLIKYTLRFFARNSDASINDELINCYKDGRRRKNQIH